MTTRRKAYWWFWLVLSGRFLDRFLAFERSSGLKHDPAVRSG